MSQQVADGEPAPIIRQISDVFPDLVVNGELAALRQQQDAHGREWLRNRGHVKHRCGRDGDV